MRVLFAEPAAPANQAQETGACQESRE